MTARSQRSLDMEIVLLSERFTREFHDWLDENWGIWLRFREEADKIRATGRTHYGARTIAEFIRHETALRERGDFKLNNNMVPDLARLYMLVTPDSEKFFETRMR